MNATTAQYTAQNVDLSSKEGKRFLRKVIRDTKHGLARWTCHASPDLQDDYGYWLLQFKKTIEGELGTPDATVCVITNHGIKTPSKHRTGTVQSFSDSTPVQIPAPRRLYETDAAIVARMILDGYSLRIETHAGSTASSKHGLGFAEFQAIGERWSTLTIGQTIYKDGSIITRGPIE